MTVVCGCAGLYHIDNCRTNIGNRRWSTTDSHVYDLKYVRDKPLPYIYKEMWYKKDVNSYDR